jgi:hypothetical protein
MQMPTAEIVEHKTKSAIGNLKSSIILVDSSQAGVFQFVVLHLLVSDYLG